MQTSTQTNPFNQTNQIRVELIDHMGSDASIVNAARVSFNKSAEQYSDTANESLIRYLARGLSRQEVDDLIEDIVHTQKYADARQVLRDMSFIKKHWTPFAHTCISLRVTAPLPIRTQCFKHKQGLVENEESRRYIQTTPEIFIPEFRQASESVKQGSLNEPHEYNEAFKELYIHQTNEAVKLYERMIDQGIPPEQARFVLPQGMLVTWIWTGNLYAFANFFISRTDSHAQKEISILAWKINDLIKPLFPISWNALTGE